MHGLGWYPIDTHFLSAKAWIGYNCYFPMPFARSARIEFEAGPEDNRAYLQVDWHRYPGQTLQEPRRFCARWRREMPTQSYGEEFLMLDADGPGQLLGFVYGVRLLDDTDRWSHGGAENIYIDGEGEHPAFLRGIGGEDTFGAGYGGALHPPETHHYAAMPYYVHDDVGQARPAQRLVGYRFFEKDTLPFQRSIHMRFGCMANDICSTTYWYQESPVRPFFTMPDWPQLLPGVELPRNTHDLDLPASGEWWLCGPFANHDGQAMAATLPPETAFRDRRNLRRPPRRRVRLVDRRLAPAGQGQSPLASPRRPPRLHRLQPPLPPLGPRRGQNRRRRRPRPLHPSTPPPTPPQPSTSPGTTPSRCA